MDATTFPRSPAEAARMQAQSVAAAPLPEKNRGGRPKGSKNKPKPPPKPKRKYTFRQLGDAQREASLNQIRKQSATIRDIAAEAPGHPAINFETINWDRRNACETDFARFCKTYLPNTFKLNWARCHLICIERIEQVFLQGGMFALALPRASGKTAMCRAAMLWGSAYAHKSFPILIGSAQPKAQKSLDYIKKVWYGSHEIRQDFPEITHAVRRLENRWHLAQGQTYQGQPTYIDWGTDSVRYPILILGEKEAAGYLEHRPDFLISLPENEQERLKTLHPAYANGAWITKSAGINIVTYGVDGSIRGEAEVHPILLTQPRPDVVLIDDVQKDNKVDSTVSCDKLKGLIDGAISLLSGPDEHIAAIMPCTVIREGDVADTFVDPEKRPEWRGERHARVIQWPDGITDESITLETEEGRAWNEYDKLRKDSLRRLKNTSLSDAYYADPVNREILDRGFICNWSEQFDPKCELSAQQACMNLRLSVGSAIFMAECQNRGRKPLGEGVVIISKTQLAEKTISLQRRVCPIDTRSLVVQIDVQDEILFYTAFASAPDFTGVFCDYGTFPDAFMPYFRKEKTLEWSLLTKMFFERYPHHKEKGFVSKYGWRAPREAKIYHALGECIRHILALKFVRDDPFHTPIHISRIGIDTRWGQVADTIKRFIRDWNRTGGAAEAVSVSNQSGYVLRDLLVPYMGKGITQDQRQMEEYERTRGWLFEDQVNNTCKEVRWVWKPDPMGVYILTVDVNRMKTFLFQRLASPPGTPGCVSIFHAPPEEHELFAEHVCESEYPQIIQNLTTTHKKEMWKEREGARYDNDYLDTCTGCMALASFTGSILQYTPHDSQSTSSQRRRLSDRWKAKKQDA